LVNGALYCIQRRALENLSITSPRLDFMRNVVPQLLASGAKVYSYRSTEYLKDMGTPERLAKVRDDWQKGRIRPPSASKREPAVFIDRDGTLNIEKGHIHLPEQLELVPGAGEALRNMRRAGYRLVVVTNQPVIARGEATEEDLLAVHSKLEWELG